MITYTFQDAFCPQWVHTHLPNPTHELNILRRIVLWQSLMDRLAPFYHPHQTLGKHLREISNTHFRHDFEIQRE